MYANLMTKKIEMTKTEAKAAGKPNTDEYNTLMQLMKDFPGYQIEIAKTSTKKTVRFKGLDFEYMQRYIEAHDKDKLETFYELRGLDKDGKKIGMAAAATYGEIKMWFLEQFPEIEEFGDKVNRIIEDTRKARAERKAS